MINAYSTRRGEPDPSTWLRSRRGARDVARAARHPAAHALHALHPGAWEVRSFVHSWAEVLLHDGYD